MGRAIRSAMPDFPPPAAAESSPACRRERVKRWRLALGGALAALVLITGAFALMRGADADGQGEVIEAGQKLPPAHSPEVANGDQAAKIAAHYLGIQDPSKLKVSVEKVVPKDDGTPFHHAWVKGRESCYLVEFTGVEIKVPWGENGHRIAPVHGLNALIAADSGKLLKVWSAEDLDATSRRRATKQLEALVRSTGSERWTGLPGTPPKVNLLQALRNDIHRNTSYLEQVDAYYVTCVRESPTGQICGGGVVSTTTTTRPTWQIAIARKGEWFVTPRGPAMAEDPLPPDPNQVYFQRLVTDGETGEYLGGSMRLQ